MGAIKSMVVAKVASASGAVGERVAAVSHGAAIGERVAAVRGLASRV